MPAHLPLITEVVDATLPDGGASHVNEMVPAGPLAVTEIAPVQFALQVTLVIVGVIVMEAGWVMLNVWTLTQFRLSVMVKV